MSFLFFSRLPAGVSYPTTKTQGTIPTWTFTQLMKAIDANQVSAIKETGSHLLVTLRSSIVSGTSVVHSVQTWLPSWPLNTFQAALNAHNVAVQVVPSSTAAVPTATSFSWFFPSILGLMILSGILAMAMSARRSQPTALSGNGNMWGTKSGTADTPSGFTSPSMTIIPKPKSAEEMNKVEVNREEANRVVRFFKRLGNRDNPVTPVVPVQTPVAPEVTFAQVGGIDEVRAELEEIVDFLKNPDLYRRLGAEIPRGILLSGAPGTGKTLLARAVAGEAGVAFIALSGSQFVEMYVGVGAARIHNAFMEARKAAPCILFIDEIDAVGGKRSGNANGGREHDHALNQLLTEMDGFDRNTDVIVMGATNRIDILDEALLRPGRFDRRVMVHAPDVKGREAILKIHTQKVPLAADVSLTKWAQQTTGFVGANLKNLVNEAAIWAARQGLEEVSHAALHHAFHKNLLGPVRNVVMNHSAKERTAYHEAGHTLMGLLTPEADPIGAVSILPRGQSLGVTVSRPDDDRHTYSFRQLEALVLTALGGRVAEEIKYGDDISTGASDDLSKATKLVRQMVYNWGMSGLGAANFAALDQEHAQSGLLGRAISEDTARLIDRQTNESLERYLLEARAQLHRHQKELKILSEALLQRETMSGEEISKLLNIANGERRRMEVGSDANAPQPVSTQDVRLMTFPSTESNGRYGKRSWFGRRRRERGERAA
jgi:cell division protease FtsH